MQDCIFTFKQYVKNSISTLKVKDMLRNFANKRQGVQSLMFQGRWKERGLGVASAHLTCNHTGDSNMASIFLIDLTANF